MVELWVQALVHRTEVGTPDFRPNDPKIGTSCAVLCPDVILNISRTSSWISSKHRTCITCIAAAMARTDHEVERDRDRDRSPKRRRYSSSPERTSHSRRSGHEKDRRDENRRRDDHKRREDRSRSRSRDHHRRREHRDRDYGRRERKNRDHDQRSNRSRSPRQPSQRSTAPLPSQESSFALTTGDPPPVEKQKPNFSSTGLLAKEANTVSLGKRAIVLKYHEPSEGRKPPSSQAWRLFHFTGKDNRQTLALGERSCWLFGREKGVVDVLLEDVTSSKQHAVIQFRYSVTRDEYGDKKERVRPYVLDLESKSGTRLNGSKIEAGRYVEVRDGDVLVFGAEAGEGEEVDEWVLMLPPAE